MLWQALEIHWRVWVKVPVFSEGVANKGKRQIVTTRVSAAERENTCYYITFNTLSLRINRKR